jgi:hypothetical protein
MKSIRTIVLGAAALVCVAGGAQAYTHHPSTPAERAQTKALNQEQLKEAQQENASLAMNTSSTATDASANMAANSPPAAAPTEPVQQPDTPRPPGSDPTSGR